MTSHHGTWFLALTLATCCARASELSERDPCTGSAGVPIPKSDIGGAMADCDAELLLFGKDGKGLDANVAAARSCAYRQRAAATSGDLSFGFDGAGILMMLYANGDGVARNIPLAKRFSCEMWSAPAERDMRLEHLDKLAASPGGAERFDTCDDITSGAMMGVCARHDARFAKFRRQRRTNTIESTWTPGQRLAYARLRDAASAYFEASAVGETDMTGTARGMFAVETSETLEDALLASIERFERGGKPVPAADTYRDEDRKLNAAYKVRLADIAGDSGTNMPGSVEPAGVRDAQRKWLAYREAWVAFGAARYPAVPADAWRAWTSHERMQRLAGSDDER